MIAKVAREHKLSVGAVQQFIKKYRRLEGRFPWKAYADGRKDLKLDPCKDYLLDFNTLVDWRCYTIGQRCAKIHAKFGIKVSAHCLRSFYQRNGIGYKKPMYSIYTPQSVKSLLQ